MQIDISSNVSALRATLDDIARTQVPFATALALTGAAKQAQADIRAQMPSIFDRPTPFTLNGIATTPARKSDLTASVFVKDVQAKYLGIEEDGGTRSPAGTALVIPVDAKVNAYGNMTKNQIATLLARPDVFSGVVNGIAGIWQRPLRGKKGQIKRPIRLLVAYEKSATYRPRFGFVDRVTKSVNASLPGLLNAAIARALTSKR